MVPRGGPLGLELGISSREEHVVNKLLGLHCSYERINLIHTPVETVPLSTGFRVGACGGGIVFVQSGGRGLGGQGRRPVTSHGPVRVHRLSHERISDQGQGCKILRDTSAVVGGREHAPTTLNAETLTHASQIPVTLAL